MGPVATMSTEVGVVVVAEITDAAAILRTISLEMHRILTRAKTEAALAKHTEGQKRVAKEEASGVREVVAAALARRTTSSKKSNR